MTPSTISINKLMFKKIRKIISIVVIMAFLGTSINTPVNAQVAIIMPPPGQMIHITRHFEPPQMVGLKIDLKDPFSFNFIMDQGENPMSTYDQKEEFNKIIKYFLVSLTMPNKQMWVNLSPYETNRIIPQVFGQTEMGRDLLAQDYILKQFTASLMYPEDGLGKEFWSKVYSQAQARFGTTEINVNTFNKVWIVADKADIYQKGDTALLVNSHLRVMLEQDFMAIEKNNEQFGNVQALEDMHKDVKTKMASDIVRQIIIPAIEKEVNEGKSFAAVRQVYNAEIMATWFKRTLRQSLLGQVFADKSKISGQKHNDPQVMEKIYRQYLKAYKKGVFNYIREDATPDGQMIPRKYFSGGFVQVDRVGTITPEMVAASPESRAMVTRAANRIMKNAARVLLVAATFMAGNAIFAPQAKASVLPSIHMGIPAAAVGSIFHHNQKAPEKYTFAQGQEQNILNVSDIGAVNVAEDKQSMEFELVNIDIHGHQHTLAVYKAGGWHDGKKNAYVVLLNGIVHVIDYKEGETFAQALNRYSNKLANKEAAEQKVRNELEGTATTVEATASVVTQKVTSIFEKMESAREEAKEKAKAKKLAKAEAKAAKVRKAQSELESAIAQREAAKARMAELIKGTNRDALPIENVDMPATTFEPVPIIEYIPSKPITTVVPLAATVGETQQILPAVTPITTVASTPAASTALTNESGTELSPRGQEVFEAGTNALPWLSPGQSDVDDLGPLNFDYIGTTTPAVVQSTPETTTETKVQPPPETTTQTATETKVQPPAETSTETATQTTTETTQTVAKPVTKPVSKPTKPKAKTTAPKTSQGGASTTVVPPTTAATTNNGVTNSGVTNNGNENNNQFPTVPLIVAGAGALGLLGWLAFKRRAASKANQEAGNESIAKNNPKPNPNQISLEDVQAIGDRRANLEKVIDARIQILKEMMALFPNDMVKGNILSNQIQALTRLKSLYKDVANINQTAQAIANGVNSSKHANRVVTFLNKNENRNTLNALKELETKLEGDQFDQILQKMLAELNTRDPQKASELAERLSNIYKAIAEEETVANNIAAEKNEAAAKKAVEERSQEAVTYILNLIQTAASSDKLKFFNDTILELQNQLAEYRTLLGKIQEREKRQVEGSQYTAKGKDILNQEIKVTLSIMEKLRLEAENLPAAAATGVVEGAVSGAVAPVTAPIGSEQAPVLKAVSEVASVAKIPPLEPALPATFQEAANAVVKAIGDFNNVMGESRGDFRGNPEIADSMINLRGAITDALEFSRQQINNPDFLKAQEVAMYEAEINNQFLNEEYASFPTSTAQDKLIQSQNVLIEAMNKLTDAILSAIKQQEASAAIAAAEARVQQARAAVEEVKNQPVEESVQATRADRQVTADRIKRKLSTSKYVDIVERINGLLDEWVEGDWKIFNADDMKELTFLMGKLVQEGDVTESEADTTELIDLLVQLELSSNELFPAANQDLEGTPVNNVNVISSQETPPVVSSELTLQEREEIAGKIGTQVNERTPHTPLGGINLSDEHLTINIKVDGAGMPLPVQYQNAAMMNLNGLTSVIRKISPLSVQNVPALYELVGQGPA